MKITVNARKVFVNKALSDHIEKKLAKFDKYFPGEAEATVKLSRVREIERVEVTIQQGSLLFRSEAESSTFMNALDCCIYAIERQIRKNKTKLSKRLRDNIRIPDYGAEQRQEDDIEEEASVMRKKSFPIKPMSVDEAILQMNLLEHEFFVFTDTDSGNISVVYKRRDGGYGLIEPEHE
mgnify:FL=1